MPTTIDGDIRAVSSLHVPFRNPLYPTLSSQERYLAGVFAGYGANSPPAHQPDVPASAESPMEGLAACHRAFVVLREAEQVFYDAQASAARVVPGLRAVPAEAWLDELHRLLVAHRR